jgi:hypothetical protein
MKKVERESVMFIRYPPSMFGTRADEQQDAHLVSVLARLGILLDGHRQTVGHDDESRRFALFAFGRGESHG